MKLYFFAMLGFLMLTNVMCVKDEDTDVTGAKDEDEGGYYLTIRPKNISQEVMYVCIHVAFPDEPVAPGGSGAPLRYPTESKNKRKEMKEFVLILDKDEKVKSTAEKIFFDAIIAWYNKDNSKSLKLLNSITKEFLLEKKICAYSYLWAGYINKDIQKYADAITMFEKSIKHNFPHIGIVATYYKALSYLYDRKINDAKKCYEQLLDKYKKLSADWNLDYILFQKVKDKKGGGN